MDNEREIQTVRMGNQSIEARPGYKITINDNEIAIEHDLQGNVTKSLWLGPGAFISWKEQ